MAGAVVDQRQIIASTTGKWGVGTVCFDRSHPPVWGLYVGGDLLSHTLPGAVPSALEGLASGFGKGPGVPHSANTTDTTINYSLRHYSLRHYSLSDHSRGHYSREHPRQPRDPQPPATHFWAAGAGLCAQGHTVDANTKT